MQNDDLFTPPSSPGGAPLIPAAPMQLPSYLTQYLHHAAESPGNGPATSESIMATTPKPDDGKSKPSSLNFMLHDPKKLNFDSLDE